jgi:DNA-binding CsgD family transcriptional regulator
MFSHNILNFVNSTNLAVMTYSKNIHGEYLACNEQQISAFGLKNKKDVLGKTDLDLLPNAITAANTFRKNDKNIIVTKQSGCFMENGNQLGTYLSIKHPLYSNDSKLIGIWGFSIEITTPKFIEILGLMANIAGLAEPNLKATQLHQRYFKLQVNKLKLSKREAECIYNLSQGKTAKEIAKVLNLSFRTVEFYINNIKNKWGCSTRSELIDKALIPHLNF